jgi:DNA-damage-inducible protein J
MDQDLKAQADRLFADMGLTMTAALTVFVKAAVRQGKIPFEITGDPFHTEANLERLRRAKAQMESGGGTIHELVDATDD